MFSQVRVITELLRLMIVGEHPIDLTLARLCAGKLLNDNCERQCSKLVAAMETLDQAHLLRMPAGLRKSVAHDAMSALEDVERRAS